MGSFSDLESGEAGLLLGVASARQWGRAETPTEAFDQILAPLSHGLYKEKHSKSSARLTE